MILLPSHFPLPSLVGGEREPAHTLKLTEDPAPPLLPFRFLSFYPSLPSSPSLPSYRVGGDNEPAHKLRFAENPAPSSSLSLPPLPSCVGGDRESGHTLRLREDRGLKRLLGMAMKQSSSRRPRVSGTNLLASLYVHKPVGQPVCTQTCWPACMYTNLLASLYVHKLVGQPVCTHNSPPRSRSFVHRCVALRTRPIRVVKYPLGNVLAHRQCFISRCPGTIPTPPTVASYTTFISIYLLRFDANNDCGSVTQMNILL